MESVSGSAAPQCLDEALEALAAAARALRSVSLTEEARQVDALADRLEPGRRVGSPNVFRCEGEYRVVLYEGDVFRLRETIGLSYLAKLLANPGREMHVLEVVGSDVALDSDAGPLVDAAARRAYRRRIRTLTQEVVDAERPSAPPLRGRRSAVQREGDLMSASRTTATNSPGIAIRPETSRRPTSQPLSSAP